MYKPTWIEIILSSVKRYLPLILLLAIMLVDGMVTAHAQTTSKPLQSMERGQDVQTTVSVWKLQPSERVDILQPTWGGHDEN